MTSYKIIFQKKALKFLEKNKSIGLRFYKVFVEISEDKHNIFKYDIKKLQNQQGFRLRLRKYGAILTQNFEQSPYNQPQL